MATNLNFETKAFILDCGGPVRDSRHALNYAYRKVIEGKGVTYTFSANDTWHLRGLAEFNEAGLALGALYALSRENIDLQLLLNSENPVQKINEIVSRQKSEISTDAYEKIVFGEARHLIKPAEGCREGLELLKIRYKLAMVTDTSAKDTLGWLEETFLADYFEFVLGKDSVPKKPNPIGILTACKKLGVEPADAAYVGDAVSDIMAARNAGCKAIAVMCGMGMEHILKAANPDEIYKNLHELAKAY